MVALRRFRSATYRKLLVDMGKPDPLVLTEEVL